MLPPAALWPHLIVVFLAVVVGYGSLIAQQQCRPIERRGRARILAHSLVAASHHGYEHVEIKEVHEHHEDGEECARPVVDEAVLVEGVVELADGHAEDAEEALAEAAESVLAVQQRVEGHGERGEEEQEDAAPLRRVQEHAAQHRHERPSGAQNGEELEHAQEEQRAGDGAERAHLLRVVVRRVVLPCERLLRHHGRDANVRRERHPVVRTCEVPPAGLGHLHELLLHE
mmetsp:Transcript_20383/g.61920  ORF Transcript_20383/g.61920 Transcript_20383/m.61920 type:complete len:229 (-) Transcript_20383:2625-3311(-)